LSGSGPSSPLLLLLLLLWAPAPAPMRRWAIRWCPLAGMCSPPGS